MPQFRDEAGNIWEAQVDAQGNVIPGTERRVNQGQIIADPTQQYEGPRAQAETARAQAQAQVATATAPATIAEAQADAQLKSAQAGEIGREQENVATQQARGAIRNAYNTDTVLRAIRNARQIVRDRGGTGFGSMMAALPSTAARALNTELSPIRGNLAFNRLQQMRDESVTGGALGQVSERELDLLASTVADLDTGVDAQTFLDRLDTIERSFIGQQLTLMGVDPQSEAGRAAYKQDFGYTGVFDGEGPQNQNSLADPNAATAGGEFPEAYQRENTRYMRDNWGNIDPRAYTAFRVRQDEANGFAPDLAGYAQYAEEVNEFADKGGSPDQLGALSPPERQMGNVEQGLNYAAQSAPGAFMANAGNAVSAGLLARSTGDQDNLELLREARPVSSFLGEAVGSGVGVAATGGVTGALGRGGASILSNPLALEAAHGTLYGATQDDNTLRGAAAGLAGTLGGEFIGRQLGRVMPNMFAGGAMRQADESVPTLAQNQEQTAELYGQMQREGIAATPDQTAQLGERLNGVLARNGQIGGDGSRIIPDGPTNQAVRMIDSFDGVPMSPQQALRARQTLGDGLMAPAPQDRRVAGNLLDEFDDWADPVLPGHSQAREVASRGIQARQIEGVTDRSMRRGARQKGNDQADAMRTAFGQLDERVASGSARFAPETADAISNVAQGDPFTNALRTLGKFGGQNPLTMGMTGGGAGLAASAMGADPLVSGGLGLGAVALGSAARSGANSRTMRAAQEAELMALGGPEYAALLESARELAARRSGSFFGGATNATASNATRQ